MTNKIALYKQVRLITNKYQQLGLMFGKKGTVFEELSNNAFLVDFTSIDDFIFSKNGEKIIETIFYADELELIE